MRIQLNKLLTVSVSLVLSQAALSQTADQINDFVKAAKFDNASEVRSLLAKGVTPNAVDSNGNPMLLLAIKDNSDKVIDVLLSNQNIDVDLSNKNGETPLMIASIQGNLPLVKRLVEKNHAAIDHIAWTPLHYASARGQVSVAEFLLSEGAIVDSRSLNDTTPLMMAVQSGNEQMVKLLLDKGADIQLRNSLGFTAIDIADIYEKPWIGDGLRSRWIKLYKKPYVRDPKAKLPKP
ncbi:ankyrin repeat domain-containing protein [Polynucleobacter sp. MWH-Creno-3A4]|uniref:ankyrin repeat domain-containing protein n=1 Tax=Polynucleobacter sp. MWH-Creno-3A4 TaxID=1855886 RepID=UPI001C0B2EAD|nr:ankyrin repeat domain-containing protein [Polynucleobacter sp. MWH-Creno-3A4]MBU3606727.1 ankyrin repeat domain-containing protein [Polynucleobacter sp. MWH-Creno-3A4]